ncbi:hypothetical protein AB0F81_17735 [Actinoplanes sp. NPDC024001]|uniref:hypothetical protein n=1 Tax=Actinoplanes sp. NPDC024001 TaxID=3154598 RepID=UPI0033EE2ACB
MLSPTQTSLNRRSGRALGAGLAVAVTGVVFAALAGFIGLPGRSPGLVVAAAGTAVVLAGGVTLGALIRSAAATPASLGQWIRRSSAGALLLTPAALLATRPFLADGWSFATCGTLVDRYRPAASDLTEFRLACDAAAGDRLLQTAILAAAGCLAAAGYGLWLRLRSSPARAESSLRAH